MSLGEQCSSVHTREDFIAFVEALRKDLHDNPGSWENVSVDRFLEALGAWVRDMDGYYKNKGISTPQPDWRFLADGLMAASMYE